MERAVAFALELNGGNQTHTAVQLRISSATLYRKLKGYGLIGNKRGLARTGARPSSSEAVARNQGIGAAS
jgi:hypothetical protein